MTFEIKRHDDYWLVLATAKSGNKYVYDCILNSKPTECQARTLWQDSRKHWRRIR